MVGGGRGGGGRECAGASGPCRVGGARSPAWRAGQRERVAGKGCEGRARRERPSVTRDKCRPLPSCGLRSAAAAGEHSVERRPGPPPRPAFLHACGPGCGPGVALAHICMRLCERARDVTRGQAASTPPPNARSALARTIERACAGGRPTAGRTESATAPPRTRCPPFLPVPDDSDETSPRRSAAAAAWERTCRSGGRRRRDQRDAGDRPASCRRRLVSFGAHMSKCL